MTISPLAIIYTIALAWFVVIVFQPDNFQCLERYDEWPDEDVKTTTA